MDGLIGISMIARLVAGNLLYRRVVTNLAAVVLLVVITGMLTGALLLGGCYASYLALIRHGLEADAAAWIVGGVMIAATLICAALALWFVRRLRDALLPLPSMPNVRRVTNAFVDGFTESGHKEERI